ncbi:MAG: guanylate kinase [Nitrospirota bacterium]
MQAKKSRGSLFVVSAPSGAGKTTLCTNVLSFMPNLYFSVSYTTRQPRPGEINDRDYTFISREDFKSMTEKGEFVEWAEVHGELYGTSRNRIETLMDSGSDVILDIDTQGALQIKEQYREGIYIFVLPPSFGVLKTRLEKRMTDSREEINKRLRTALSEINTYAQYDYVIINDMFEDALKELASIIIAQRVSVKKINPLWIQESFSNQEEK